ncbi:MAG: N-formylglutamate deformylase [Rubrivivax sp.]|nr:N-formylglutamate deformylase [Rubrivivax sp.]
MTAPAAERAAIRTENYTLLRGTLPLLVSVPHCGTAIPSELRHLYTERALQAEDTDWHLERLYAFVHTLAGDQGQGASLLVPRLSRYVIDLNRDPSNAPMYPGRNNTELCPTRHFTGEPIYREGQAPDEAEIHRRVATCFRPYHDALAAELQRLKSVHGHAVLFDAHSIKSELPWLFEGTLPHMNLGTVEGTSCAPALREALAGVFAAQGDYSHVVDGRFKGGQITRQYGRPAEGVHAVQLEMCWRAYMEETAPYAWHEARAAAVTPLLKRLVQAMIDWKPR